LFFFREKRQKKNKKNKKDKEGGGNREKRSVVDCSTTNNCDTTVNITNSDSDAHTDSANSHDTSGAVTIVSDVAVRSIGRDRTSLRSADQDQTSLPPGKFS
jgi:hypothetical protein